MKISVYLLAPALLTGLIACSKSDSSPGPGTVQAGNPSSHKVEQCPQLNGTFRDSSNSTKVIKTEQQNDGVTINDTSVQWVINGKRQEIPTKAGAWYIGMCFEKKIVIDLFLDNQLLGIMNYAFSNGSDLTIEMQAINRKFLEKDKKETWTIDKQSISPDVSPATPRRLYFEDSNAKTFLTEITSSGAETQESNGEMLWTAREIICHFNTRTQLGRCSMEVQRSAQTPLKVENDLDATSMASALMDLNLMKCQGDDCTGAIAKAECGYKIDSEKLPTGSTFCYLTR
ncbi:MAG: hypothetical protein JNJ49_00680 [Bdellovibrionaceae bacterium]|nr:hypothetical protein [Pseudobdellovibrionaceae bacterium]